MRRSLQGVRQLGQALQDFGESRPLCAVDENGEVKRTADGSSEQTLSDIYLRNEFPPPGKAKAARPGDTPIDRYNAAVGTLSKVFEDLEQAFEALSKVVGDDSQPIVEVRGVDLRLTDAWRDVLRRVDEETVIWARAFRKMYGAKSSVIETRSEEDENAEDRDPYADVEADLDSERELENEDAG
jgi:hypothetical protein